MVDVAFSAPDEASMDAAIRYVYQTLTETVLADDQPTPASGQSSTGTHWAVSGPLTFMEPTGETTTDEFGNEVPVMAQRAGAFRDGRWNGGDPFPPVVDPIVIVWRSDMVDEITGEPVPKPDWWTHGFA